MKRSEDGRRPRRKVLCASLCSVMVVVLVGSIAKCGAFTIIPTSNIFIPTTNSPTSSQSELVVRNSCCRRLDSDAVVLQMSDWSDFSALDDNDDLDELKVDTTDYAVEENSQEAKAQVGATLASPVIENDAPPLQVPAGSQLALDEDTVKRILSACRNELGTLFGYTAENRGVGITGGVDFVEMDGPVVVLRLKGRYWHERTTVLERVANYLQQRIPEIVDVTVEDDWQLTDEANEIW